MADPLIDLTTVQAATAYLQAAGLPVPADLEDLITGVSAEMQSFASRNFVSQPYSVTLSGQGGDRLNLPNTPISSVESVAVDGLNIPSAGNPTSFGFVFSETQILLRGYRFCRGVQNIQIAYTAGYTPVPADIARAANEGILAVAAALDAGDPRAISLKAGGSAITFARDSGELALICLTPNVTRVLNQRLRTAPM